MMKRIRRVDYVAIFNKTIPKIYVSESDKCEFSRISENSEYRLTEPGDNVLCQE